MFAEFEVELTKPEYVTGLRALSGELVKRDKDGPRRIYERLAAMVVLILAAGYFFPQSMTGMFFIVIAWALLEWLLARRWTGSVHGVSFDPTLGPAKIRFSDEGISDSNALRKRQWQWAAVTKVHDRPGAIIFQFAGWDMLILPDRLWPDLNARRAFVTEVRPRLPETSNEAISEGPSPMPLTADFFRLAAIGAFVDVFLILALLLPQYTERFGPLADDLGFAGGMLLYTLLSAALGYTAYRASQVGLPHLHALSPLAARIVAQVLIWAFAVWFAGAYLRWW